MDRVKTSASLLVSLPSALLFFQKHSARHVLPRIQVLWPLIQSLYERVGVIGFCWGGKVACWLAAQDQVVCMATAHPSFLDSQDLDISVPGLFLHAQGDSLLSSALIKKIKELSNLEFVEYASVVHGFTIRGREDEDVVVQARMDAMNRCVSFFNHHLQSV